jgi:hypothetical protein
MPQIGKYKYKFRTEILCGALWGECILIIYWQFLQIIHSETFVHMYFGGICLFPIYSILGEIHVTCTYVSWQGLGMFCFNTVVLLIKVSTF